MEKAKAARLEVWVGPALTDLDTLEDLTAVRQEVDEKIFEQIKDALSVQN